MAPDEVRKMIRGHQVATPYVIETRDGRSFTIPHPDSVFIPHHYPNTVLLALRESALIYLNLDEIESLHAESEPLSETRAIPDLIDSTEEDDDLGSDDFCQMIKGQQLATPYVIMTRGGRSYTISNPKNAYIPPAYPTTVALFIPTEGVIMLDLDAIEAIHYEPEAVAGGPPGGLGT
jgi:hypothetical protein